MHNWDIEQLKTDTKKLFTDQIWSVSMDNLSRARKEIVRLVKITRITFNEFAEGRMGFQCVALSYFGALATIPFVAFLFFITGGLGFSDKVLEFVHGMTTNVELIDLIFNSANNILTAAQSGVVGLVSGLTFFFTIFWWMFQIERVFNNVWKTRKIPRTIFMRILFYFVSLLLVPVILMVFGTGIALYTNIPQYIGIKFDFKELSTLMSIVGWLIIYFVSAFSLSAMYKFIPAAKLKYKHALLAALVTSLIFIPFQYLYLETQVFINRLNGVYGALAAIPLYLIWMNFSWQIIIYGAQLSYGLEHVDKYIIPEGKLKDFTPLRDRLRREYEEGSRKKKLK